MTDDLPPYASAPPAYDEEVNNDNNYSTAKYGSGGGEGAAPGDGPGNEVPMGVPVGLSDLDVFFDRFSDHYSASFRSTLVSYGATLPKLLEMNETQIFNYAKIDPTLATDLILLVQDLQTFKNEKNGNINTSYNGTTGRTTGTTTATTAGGLFGSHPSIAIVSTTTPATTSVVFGKKLKTATTTNTTKLKTVNTAKSNVNTAMNNALNTATSYKYDTSLDITPNMSLWEILATVREWMGEHENFNFLFCWIVCLVSSLFVVIYSATVSDATNNYRCDTSCDTSTTTSYFTDEPCECDEFDYSGRRCGQDSDGSTVYCETYTPNAGVWTILAIAVPIGSYLLLVGYFIRVFKVSVVRAPVYAIVFIPLGCIATAFSCIFIFLLGGVFFPIIEAAVGPQMSLGSSTSMDANGKESYNVKENRVTHWHVIETIIRNNDVRFWIFWPIMVAITWFVFGYTIPDCAGDYWDPCESGDPEYEAFETLVPIAFLSDYVIVWLGFLFVCKMNFVKAFVLAIPMTAMMVGLSVPFSILRALATGVGKILSG